MRKIDKASFSASAAKAGAPELIPGHYPRAWPVETCAHTDGSVSYAIAFDGAWHLLPEAALEHAAHEVGVSSDALVTPANYARGVALLLTALRRCGWAVEAPSDGHDILDTRSPDA